MIKYTCCLGEHKRLLSKSLQNRTEHKTFKLFIYIDITRLQNNIIAIFNVIIVLYQRDIAYSFLY